MPKHSQSLLRVAYQHINLDKLPSLATRIRQQDIQEPITTIQILQHIEVTSVHHNQLVALAEFQWDGSAHARVGVHDAVQQIPGTSLRAINYRCVNHDETENASADL